MGKSKLGSAIIDGGIEGLVVSFLNPLFSAAKDHVGDYLKSNILNIGTNDEELYHLARAYCLEKGWATIDELFKVREVIDSYDLDQRKRIIGMIGKREGDGSTSAVKIGKDGNPVINGKTKEEVMETTNFKTNVAGAKILAMFAKMTKEQIKQELDSSGASASFIHEAKEKIAKATVVIENSQVVKDCESFFTKETWLEKKLREAKSKI